MISLSHHEVSPFCFNFAILKSSFYCELCIVVSPMPDLTFNTYRSVYQSLHLALLISLAIDYWEFCLNIAASQSKNCIDLLKPYFKLNTS